MEYLKVCLRELSYARSDLLRVKDYLETALEAVEEAVEEAEGKSTKKDTLSTKKDELEGALYRVNMLRKELKNLLEKFEATATEK